MSGLWPIVLVAVLAMLGLMLYVLVSSRTKTGGGSGSMYTGAAEVQVRRTVDQVANLVLELADRVEWPGNEQARRSYAAGAGAFFDLQGPLEEADTRSELEAVWPALVECRWHLEVAEALVEGRPSPARPTPEALFPTEPLLPPVGGRPVPSPRPLPPPAGYRSHDRSPWLTDTAVSALSLLAARSGRTFEQRRPAGDDAWFTARFDGGTSGPTHG